MKIELDCVRSILEAIEDLPTRAMQVRPNDVPGWDREFVDWHMKMLVEGGFIRGEKYVIAEQEPFMVAWDLTLKGAQTLTYLRPGPIRNGIFRLGRECELPVTLGTIHIFASAVLDQMFPRAGERATL